MKAKLQIVERINLLSVLPEKGNFATLRVVDDLRRKLAFTDEELTAFEMKIETDRVLWNKEKDTEVEMEFGEFAEKLIVDTLKELDKKEMLEAKHKSLYEKFVEKQ